MSTARHIRQARQRAWPLGHQDPDEDDDEGDWEEPVTVGDATELPAEDGMAQFRLAERLWEQKS